MKITIDELLALKLAKIEADQQKLMERKNGLSGLRATDSDSLILAATQLEYFLSDLFRDEEFVLEESGANDIARHVSLHRDLMAWLRSIRWSYVEARNQGLAQDPQQLLCFIDEYMSTHRQTVDAAAFSRIEKRLPPPVATPVADRPAGRSYADFDELCLAAISLRVRRVLAFFQQGEPRESAQLLPPLFFAAPAFGEALETAIAQVIYPRMKESSSLRRLSAGLSIRGLDEETFWQRIPDTLCRAIMAAWSQAWDHLRPIEGRNDSGVTVMRVRRELKELREILGFKQQRGYDLPACGNRELDLMKSLFDPRNDWGAQLDECWTILSSLYELEFTKGEVREGALRDMLLKKIDELPPGWGDPLLFTCYRAMPFITTVYIDVFSTNLGRSETQREAWLPYITLYLRKVKASRVVRDQEILEIRKLREASVELRLTPEAV